MSSAVSAAVLPRTAAWRDVLALLKLRIDALVVLVALASAVAAGTRDPEVLVALSAACFASSAGASALNHYLEREADARMGRTRHRPLPSGRIAEPRIALWLGVGLIVASQVAIPVLGVATCLYLLAGAATYAFVYTWWLKPRTPYSIVLGGAAGSFAALAGWQTGATTLALAPLLFAAVLFLWTPSHFWSLAIVYEDDYRAAGIPMLPAVVGARRTASAVHANTIALVATSLALVPLLGVVYGVAAALAGAVFLRDTHAWRTFKASGLYLLALLVGLILSTL